MIQSIQNSTPRRFWLAIAVQGLLIATLTLPPLLTYWQGSTVILQMIPVDPYDLLRGYSQTLRYDISNPSTLQTLPGGQALDPLPKPNTPIYVTLQPPDRQERTPPASWTAIAVSLDPPANLPENTVLLRGEFANNYQILYGLERYYFPEAQQQTLNKQIADAFRAGSPNLLRVEVRVDRRGQAVPVALWIGDRRYQF